jgi:hypothetical protein
VDIRLAFLLKLKRNLVLAGTEDLTVCCDGASLCQKTRRMQQSHKWGRCDPSGANVRVVILSVA